MTRRGWSGLAALVAWTVFVWSNRLVNAWGSDTESTADKVTSSLLAAVLLGFAVVGVVVLVRTWRSPLTAGWARVVQVFAGLTVAVWAVRVPQIFLADHELAFQVVHALLGVVAIALAVWTWRAVAPAASGRGGPGRAEADGAPPLASAAAGPGGGATGDAGAPQARH
ncbi:hypothetical protein [Rhabdothermincola salaria]|uniref:hypothetical protein n=1 Tax=Rhabdothermincola salaria TaxID=2903142 RepID=UPI001E3869F5|nr:hypothetical protein [Rhabdothermincola salaria]MCD9623591.1 hypothetical protein [Rhabdothermincola salaria]